MARWWIGYVSEHNLSASVKGTSNLSSFVGLLDSFVIFFTSFSVFCGILLTCARGSDMALVNCSVYNPSEKRIVSPWKIVPVGASGRTVQQFFTETISKEIDCENTLELVAAFLGRSKKQLDKVDTSVPLDMAVQSFGGFLRYHVSSSTTP